MYGEFARIYDALMLDVPYEKWAGHIFNIFRRFGCRAGLGLDLGCGTGTLTLELAARGCDMIGVDLSTEMLNIARAKAVERGADVLFLNQNMTEFELYGTVDFIVSSLDCVNYITSKNSLKRMFKLVNNYLNPGGLFVFDVNTEYKLSRVLGSNCFVSDGEDIFYSWQNCYDHKSRLCDFYLTFFEKQRDGLYSRFDEVHTERAYSRSEIEAMLVSAGLRLEGVFHDLTFQKPRENSERLFFVAREQGKSPDKRG